MNNSENVLQKLLEGNRRYASGLMEHPHHAIARRAALIAGQQPVAAILGCADSRVPPEIVFDQGLGDLFVVRVAGNVVDDVILGSLEYAAGHLHVPLIMVLGHSGCGAVNAALAAAFAATPADGKLEGHLPSLAAALQPAINRAKEQPGDVADLTVRANARLMAEQLCTSTPILAEMVSAGQLRIVAARYDLESGVVEVLA